MGPGFSIVENHFPLLFRYHSHAVLISHMWYSAAKLNVIQKNEKHRLVSNDSFVFLCSFLPSSVVQ